MTIDHPADDHDELSYILRELSDDGLSGGVIAENHIQEIENGLHDGVFAFEVDAERIAEEVAEKAEDKIRKAALGRVDDATADEAGLEAGEEAYETALRLIREEDGVLTDKGE